MKKYISFLAISITAAWAGPEKFDHLGDFKQPIVKSQGPQVERVFDSQGQQVAEARYLYNSARQLVEARFFVKGQEDGHNTFKYNKNGLLRENLYNASGSKVEFIRYKTSRGGIIESYQVFGPKGKEELRWEFVYIRNKLQSGKRFIGESLTEKFINRYDKKTGSMNQLMLTGTNEQVGSIIHKYQKGMLKSRFIEDRTGQRKITYHYDKKGRLVEMKFFQQQREGMQLVKSHKLEYKASAQAKGGMTLGFSSQ